MHLRVLLRAAGWFAGTLLVTLMFYPIIYGDSWTLTNQTTFAVRVLAPAFVSGWVAWMYYTLFSDDSTQPR